MSVYGRIYGAGNSDIPPQEKTLPEMKPEEPKNKPSQRRKNAPSLLSGLLPDGIDRDTLLIAAILLLLLKEGGDIRLVLALGYILL